MKRIHQLSNRVFLLLRLTTVLVITLFINQANASDFYSLTGTETIIYLAPEPPESSLDTVLASEATTTSIRLDWESDNNENTNHYIVHVSEIDSAELLIEDGEKPSFSYEIESNHFLLENGFIGYYGSDTTVTIQKLIPGRTYNFSVYAVNEESDSIAIDRDTYAYVSESTEESPEYYWVGGTGSWEDVSHWATTSGGSIFHDSIPHRGAKVILDENSFIDEEEPIIYAFRGTQYEFYSLDGTQLDERVVIANDSLGLYPNYYQFNSFYSFNPGDSLYLGSRDIGVIGIDTVNYVNFNDNNSNEYAGLFTDGAQEVIIEELPSELGTIDLTRSFVVFPEDMDTLSLDRWWDFTSEAENIPALTDLHTAVTVQHFPYISTHESEINFSRWPKVDVLDIRASTMRIYANDTLEVREIIKSDDLELFIYSELSGIESYIYTTSDSLTISNAEIIDNHAVGSAVYTAKNSVLMDNTDGWTVDGERDPSEPQSVPFPYLEYGDSTTIDAKWDLFYGTNTVVTLRELGDPRETPQNDTFYKSDSDNSLADSIGNAYIYDVERELEFSFDQLKPSTAYVLELFSYHRSSDKVTYSSEGEQFEFVTTGPEDIFFFDEGGSVEVDETTLYSQFGIGFPILTTFDFGTITLKPNETGKKVGFKVQSLDVESGGLFLYDGESTNDPLLGEINLEELYEQGLPNYDSIYIPTNEDGILTIRYSLYSGSGEKRKGAKFYAFTMKDLAPEPDTLEFLTASNATTESINLEWAMESDAFALILAGESDSLTSLPVDRIKYDGNSIYGVGEQIGNDHFVVYSGNENNVTVSGLVEDTNYHFFGFTYANSDSTDINYNESYLITDYLTDFSAPEELPTLFDVEEYLTDVTINYWKGDEVDGSLLILKDGTDAITAVLEDDVFYTGESDWGDNVTELSDGSKVVFNNIFNSPDVNVTSLSVNTTYQYAIYNYDERDGIYKYNSVAVAGEFTTFNTGYEVNSGDLTLVGCLGEPYTFTYNTRGPEVEQEKNAIIYADYDVSTAVFLDVLDDNGSEMTVLIPSDVVAGTYSLNVQPADGRFVYYPSDITLGSAPTPIISREDLQLIASDAENGFWYRNNEFTEVIGSSLDIDTDGIYRVEQEFGNCVYVSEDFVVLPELTFETVVNGSYCKSPEIEFGSFGDALVDGDYVLSLAGEDSIYDESIIIEDFTSSNVILNIPEELAPGTYYTYLSEAPIQLEAEVFMLTVDEVTEPEITVTDFILESNYEAGNQWFKDGEEIEGVTEKIYLVTEEGDYHLAVTVDECLLETESIFFDITDTKDSVESHLSLQPNPTRDFVNVKYQGHQNEKVDIQLMTLEGKILNSSEVILGNDTNHSISLIDQPSGMYFILVIGDGWSVHERLLKD